MNQKKSNVLVKESKGFDINSLSKRKTSLQGLTDYTTEGAYSMSEVIEYIQNNDSLKNSEYIKTRQSKTISERIINDKRYKSSRVERLWKFWVTKGVMPMLGSDKFKFLFEKHKNNRPILLYGDP